MKQTSVLAKVVSELASQDLVVLEGENKNPLMLLTVFLTKTKQWNETQIDVKFLVKNTSLPEVENILSAARMRLSRMRSRLTQQKVTYKKFVMLARIDKTAIEDDSSLSIWLTLSKASSNSSRATEEGTKLLEELLQ